MQLTLDELKQLVASQLSATTIAGSFSSVVDFISGLQMKCAMIKNQPSNFRETIEDYFNGDDLPVGGYIEEYFQHMVAPISYDNTGANTLVPHYPDYAPASYSYPIEGLNFPITLSRVEFQRYFNSVEEASAFMAMRLKSHADAQRIYKSELKRGLLGYMALRCVNANEGAATFATSTAYAAGAFVKTTGAWGIVVKAIANTNTKTWAQLVAEGTIVVLDLVASVTAPVDSATGEAFIKAIKEDVEKASRPSSDHTLNGVIAQPDRDDLVLVLKEGVMPSLEVDTYAGAFHRDDLNTGVKQLVVKDFGEWTSTGGTDIGSEVLAMLVDARGLKIHLNGVQTDEQINAEGHFATIFTYLSYTPYISPNTFVKVYLG